MNNSAQLALLARRRVMHRALYVPQSGLVSQVQASQPFLFGLVAQELLTRLDYTKIAPKSVMLMCAGTAEVDLLKSFQQLRQLYVNSDLSVYSPDCFSHALAKKTVDLMWQQQKQPVWERILSSFKAKIPTQPAIGALSASAQNNTVDLCIPVLLPMVSECYQGLNRWVNRTGMVHGAVLSGIAMSGDGIGKDELKYEHINAKKLGDLLSVQMFQDIVIDAWSLPLAYHSIEQMLSELSPWWLGQNQMHLQTKGLRGRSSLDQFINDLKQQLYVSKTGLFELELECLFFQAIYDPLPVKKNEFMISPSQIKVRAK